MKTMATLLENGKVKAHITTPPFTEMAQAHLELESGRTVGKMVVQL